MGCLYCQHTLGCQLLFGKDGKFDAGRLVMEDNPRQCGKFVEIEGARERGVRERMFNNFGLGYLRALHELPELVMEGLRQGEKDELMYENVPNFQDPRLLWEGMTSIEREDILRHQTDENGQIIVEIDSEGVEHKLARPEYHIKAYMCDPNGPIHADKAVTWVWNINQVIDYILKIEAENGLIVKTKKQSPADATPEEQPQPEKREANMAGREVRTIRTAGTATPAPTTPAAPAAAAPAARPAAPSAAPAARRVAPKPAATPAPARAPAPTGAPAATSKPGRVANPPARRVATPAGAPGRPAAAPAAGPAAPAAAPAVIDTDLIERCVFKVVSPMFEELLNLMKASQQTTIDCATILGDIAGQTGGTFQIEKIDEEGNYVVREDGSFVKESPQLWTHPSKIFAHVEGTGFNPENLTTIRTPADPPDEVVPAEQGEEVPEGEA